MKRVHKNILGVSGLVLVAGMTACAAMIPSPEAMATSASVTDTLTVRVIEDKAFVELTPVSVSSRDATITVPNYVYDVSYNHAQSLEITLEYVELDGTTKHTLVWNYNDLDYNFGEKKGIALDLGMLTFDDQARAGMGSYKITAKAISMDGTPVYSYLTFNYYGFTIGGTEQGGNKPGEGPHTPVGPGGLGNNGDENTEAGDDDGTGEGPFIWIPSVAPGINRILVKTMVNGKVYTVGRAQGDFSLEKFRNGFYIRLYMDEVLRALGECRDTIELTVEAYKYSGDEYPGELIYWQNYTMHWTCYGVPNTGAPDTGGLFQDLNISKEDYLITGLIVFFVLGIVGIGVVSRSHKATTDRKRR